MVNRSVAKRAKHAKPALRKGYWAKSSSSVLAVALAASLVPAVPALGDEFDADVSDIEATEPPAFDAPIPTEPSSTAPDALAELEAGDRATSVDSKSDAGNKGALPESGGAEGVGDRTFGEVDDAGFREGLGAEALAAAEVQEESSGQGSSTTWVPEGPENSWRYEDGVALGSLAAPGARTASSTTPTWTSSNGATTYTLGGKRVTVSGAKAVGIDVSVHQGSIDWAKVKAAGITFAIIRCGYGSDIEEQDDKCFLQNVEGARKNGIQIGIYLYSYAKKATGSAPSAQSEAEHVLRLLDSDHANLKPSDLALPIYYDLEDDSQLSLTDAQRGQLAETFCNKIQAAGYKVGIYANKTWWEKYLTSPVFNNRSWSRWIAQYPGSAIGAPDVTFSSDLWQFTESGQVSGGSGNCDVNFSFTSFSSTPQEVVLTGTPNTWAWMNGYAYYYGSDGKAVKWSQKIDGKWYYFDGQCRMKTGWVTWSADGTKSYFQPGEDGKAAALTGWHEIDGEWYYFNPSNGISLRWSQKINGNWFYFNGESQMVTGWVTWSADGTKSYFDPSSGRAWLGWQTIGNKKYYFNPANGISKRWSQKIDGSWYYFNGDSVMETGWITWKDGTKSFFDWDGKALLGWRSFQGRKCYFDPNTGISRRYSQKIDGAWYYFSSDSFMFTGLLTWHADGLKSYYGSDGKLRVGWQNVNGKRYYFEQSSGKSVRWSQWIDGSLYYFNTDSEMVTGWVTWKADGSKSYFDGNGRALMEWQTIGGKTYYFNPSNGQSLRGMQVIDGQSYYFNERSELVGAKSETKTEATGVSLATLAAKELRACPSALKYTQADIVASMTPTSCGAGTSGYYQFAQLNHGYSGMVSAAQLDAYIASTANGRTGTLAGNGEAFVNAARRYGVNEVYLLAHAILESGWGTSTLAKGYVYDGKTLVDGKTWPKGTYYNFYGIGAYDSSPLSGGRALAIKNGWDTPEKAIHGAARWIATNYLNNAFSQNTLYKMRWNYVEYARYGSVGHQYATDRDWATKIGSLMNAIYASASVGQAKTGLTFLVPSYR